MIDIKVMKFGGSILSSSSDVEKVCRIISLEEEVPVIVLSAMNGITDHIGYMMDERDLEVLEARFKSIDEYHGRIIDETIHDEELKNDLFEIIEGLIDECRELLLKNTSTDHVTDRILTLGERISVHLLSTALKDRNIPNEPLLAEDIGLVAAGPSCSGYVDMNASSVKVRSELRGSLDRCKVPVITGFYGINLLGETISFGRNGSDHTSAAIAAIMKADILEIWKDVPGFMSADPNIIKDARRIEHLTYDEASELAHYGALILHPHTIDPLRADMIPLYIKNLHDPDQSTRIHEISPLIKGKVRSVSFSRKIGVIKILGKYFQRDLKVLGEITKKLEESSIKLRSITTSVGCILLILDRCDLSRCKRAVSSISDPSIERIELKSDLSIVGIVGEGLFGRPGTTSSILNALVSRGIEVEILSAGSSDVSLFIAVKESDLSMAVSAVHEDQIVSFTSEIQIEHENMVGTRYA